MANHDEIYRSQAEAYEDMIGRQPDLSGTVRQIRDYRGLDVLDLGAGSGRLFRGGCDQAHRVFLRSGSRGGDPTPSMDDGAGMRGRLVEASEIAPHNEVKPHSPARIGLFFNTAAGQVRSRGKNTCRLERTIRFRRSARPDCRYRPRSAS